MKNVILSLTVVLTMLTPFFSTPTYAQENPEVRCNFESDRWTEPEPLPSENIYEYLSRALVEMEVQESDQECKGAIQYIFHTLTLYRFEKGDLKFPEL